MTVLHVEQIVEAVYIGIEVTCGTSQTSSGQRTLATVFILLINFLVTMT